MAEMLLAEELIFQFDMTRLGLGGTRPMDLSTQRSPYIDRDDMLAARSHLRILKVMGNNPLTEENELMCGLFKSYGPPVHDLSWTDPLLEYAQLEAKPPPKPDAELWEEILNRFLSCESE